jgi:ABC-type uncharacterized transport system substrate-binding protein
MNIFKHMAASILLVTFCAIAVANPLSGKRVLFVNSYHQGLASSDDQVAGAMDVLKPLGVDVKIHYMDTKRKIGDAFGKTAALAALEQIKKQKPDLVIASDDAAAKYLIAPYLKNTAVPVVFSGVNWDASPYGLPATNVTGVIEVEPVKSMIQLLSRYAKGTRIGFIGADTLPERRNIDTHRHTLKVKYTDGYFVSTFDEFKKRFLELQTSVDMIVTASPVGIDGWDAAAAATFVVANGKVPLGGTVEWVSGYSLVTISGVLREQGTLAGRMAARILSGEKPGDIPVVENTDGKLYVNMSIANSLGIAFEPSVLRTAVIIR